MVVLKQLMFVSLLGLMVFADVAESLKVASFNIQVLGVSKMSKPDVVDILVQIIARYDLVLVQEYRDKSGEAVVDLLDALNTHVGSNQYKFEIGARVGRSSSKEQYIYFYKAAMLTVLDSYNWDDSSGDVFEREPYIVKFYSPTTTQKEFAFVNMHVKPDDAVNENDFLADVYDDAVKKYGVPIIVSGDLNADCNYVRDEDWVNIRLRSDSRFHWIIPDNADTTVSSTDCAYDRHVGSNQYKFEIGARVGRSSSKEQYIYFYKAAMLTVLDSYNWDDSSGDVFEREPYIVKFYSPTTTQKEFAFVNMHVKPDDAVNENDFLADVYDDAVKKYGVPIIVSGDLNADCNYVRDEDWVNIRLRSDSRFHWIIPDNADTTVSSTDCAYDRWVVDDDMKNKITSPGVFYYDTYYDLTYEEADDVSDHYPVVMTIN